jgi:hypothetical protein
MNRFLDQLVNLYTPLRLRGLLMDGQYRFAPDAPQAVAARPVEADLSATAPRQASQGSAPKPRVVRTDAKRCRGRVRSYNA